MSLACPHEPSICMSLACLPEADIILIFLRLYSFDAQILVLGFNVRASIPYPHHSPLRCRTARLEPCAGCACERTPGSPVSWQSGCSKPLCPKACSLSTEFESSCCGCWFWGCERTKLPLQSLPILHPEGGSDLEVAIENIDLALTVFFSVELLMNMAAYWFWRFWGDGWFLIA
jgi:hypothetical protein